MSYLYIVVKLRQRFMRFLIEALKIYKMSLNYYKFVFFVPSDSSG